MSEERRLVGEQAGGRWRARSVDCLQTALRGAEQAGSVGSFASLPPVQASRAAAGDSLSGRAAGSAGVSDGYEVDGSERALPAAPDRPGGPDDGQSQRMALTHEPARTAHCTDHKIKITLGGSADEVQIGDCHESKPKMFFFGMAPSVEDRREGEANVNDGKVSALVKVKRNEEVSIAGVDLSYRKITGKSADDWETDAVSVISPASSEPTAVRPSNIQRIPTQKLNDFMSTLERSRRRQLSASRNEILTNSPARSTDLSCPSGTELDMELQLGAESISMRLRPTLPKKQQQMPRFSPLAAWKSLKLDPSASRERRDQPANKRPLGQQLSHQSSAARSADSGLASPPTQSDEGGEEPPPLAARSPAPAPPSVFWTPAQDLDASSGDEASVETDKRRHSTLPKLMSRGGMFGDRGEPLSAGGKLFDSRRAAADLRDETAEPAADGTTSPGRVQSPKHCLDPNWLLSRSVPNSLNAQSDSPDAARPSVDVPSDVGGPSTSRHVVYLPEYRSMTAKRDRSVSPLGNDVTRSWPNTGVSDGRHQPDARPRSSAPVGNRHKFAFQSTLRLIEKKKLEARLVRETEEKEGQRLQEQEAMQRVERQFQQKRGRQNGEVPQTRQMWIADLDESRDRDRPPPAATRTAPEPATSSDITSSVTGSDLGFSSHKESAQSSPRSGCDASAPTQFQLLSPAESADRPYWEPPECPSPDYNSLPPLLDQVPEPPMKPMPAVPAFKKEKSRFLSGVKTWLRGKKEGRTVVNMRREDPEGAAATSPDPAAGLEALGPGWHRGPNQLHSGGLVQAEFAAERFPDVTEVVGVGRVGRVTAELSPPSSAESANQQPSSGYESSPSLDTSKRLTHELQESRHGRQESRRHRSPAARYPPHRARRRPTSEGFGVGQQGRHTPAPLYSEPLDKVATTKPTAVSAMADPRREANAAPSVTSHSNYRWAFARGSAPHPTSAGSGAPERNCRTPTSLVGGDRTASVRAARRLPCFQRSRSHHELHLRDQRLQQPGTNQPTARRRSEERLDGPWRRPPPAQAALASTVPQHWGYVPRYINNRPARLAHSPGTQHAGGGHRRLVALVPARSAASFAV